MCRRGGLLTRLPGEMLPFCNCLPPPEDDLSYILAPIPDFPPTVQTGQRTGGMPVTGRFVMWSLQKLVCFSVLFAIVLKYFCIFAHVLKHV